MRFTHAGFKGFNTMILLVLAIIILCCTLELISYQSSSEALFDSITQSYESIALDSAKLLSKSLKEKLLALEIIAEGSEVVSMDWESQRRSLLIHINTLGVNRFLITDRNGLARSTDNAVIDISDRHYFREALQGIANVSDVIESKVDNSMVIAYAVPIKDKEGNVIGVLSSSMEYQALSNMVKDIKVGKEGYAVIINKDGDLIANATKDIVQSKDDISKSLGKNTQFNGLSFANEVILPKEDRFDFYRHKNSDKFVAFTPIHGTDWFLGLIIPKSEVFNKIESLRRKFIIETVIFIFVAIVLTFFLYAYLMQRKKVMDLQRDINENYRNLIKVEQLDRLKTEFFANITHEIRTPINVIYGSLQLFEHFMQDGMSNAKDIRKRIKTMKQNCFRLLRLVNNLIDVTKIDAGYFQLNLKNDNIISVVEDITQSVADYIKDKGIEIIFDTEVEERITAFDHDKIERVILNLLSNACKFTQKGGRILVYISDKDDRIEVSVKDTGVGIPQDKQQLVFERFRQVNQSLIKTQEGSGIGLSLVKSLVEMHDGRVSVRSELGNGSEFIVELPVKVLDEEKNEADSTHKSDIHDHIDKLNVEFSDIYF